MCLKGGTHASHRLAHQIVFVYIVGTKYAHMSEYHNTTHVALLLGQMTQNSLVILVILS